MSDPSTGFRSLPVTPDIAELRNRHRDFYRGLVRETAEAQVDGVGEPWIDLLEADLDNLRAAIEWSFSSGDAGAALELAAGCRTLWEHGRYREGRHWLGRGLAAESVPTRARAEATLALAGVVWMSGEHAETDELSGGALRLARQIDDDVLLARALRQAAWAKHLVNRDDLGLVLAEESIEVARRAGRNALLAHCIRGAGWITFATHDIDTALARHAEALEVATRAAPEVMLANLRDYAGMLELAGRMEEAREAYERALALRRRESLSLDRAVYELLPLARISRAMGDTSRARSLFEEVSSLSAGFDDKGYFTGALVNQAEMEIEQGNLATARANLLEVVELVTQQDLEPGPGAHGNLSTAFGHLAEIAEWEGDPALARHYLERQLAIPRAAYEFKVLSLRLLGALCYRLGDLSAATRFARAAVKALEDAAADGDVIVHGRATLAAIEGEFERGYALLTAGLDPNQRASWHLQLPGWAGGVGLFALRAGDLEVARADLEYSIEYLDQSHEPCWVQRVHLAEVDLAEGRVAPAREALLRLAVDWRRFWPVHNRIALVDALARATVATGDHLHGAELLGTAQGERMRVRHVKPPYLDKLLDAAAAEARAGLGDEAFEAAFERGRRTPLDHALDRVVGEGRE